MDQIFNLHVLEKGNDRVVLHCVPMIFCDRPKYTHVFCVATRAIVVPNARKNNSGNQSLLGIY